MPLVASAHGFAAGTGEGSALRYFFDVDDGRRRVHDEVGRTLISQESAVLAAGVLLQSLAEIRQIEGRPGTTYVTVRNAQGTDVFSGSTSVNR